MNPKYLLRLLASEVNLENARRGAMPAEELRYCLEFAVPPDLTEVKAQLGEFLDTDRFLLERFIPSDDTNSFVVLRFPGVEPTLSRDHLFATAYEIQDVLGLVSCEPDLNTRIFADPLPPKERVATEGLDVLAGLCWANGDAPANNLWALENAKVDKAWLLNSGKGEGIIIAQPDTGVATHPDLENEALRRDLARDILVNDDDPTDPLDRRTANPGHGTSTGSVAVSREAGNMSGSAPKADLVPIRCTTDVKFFNALPVARAIAHARSIGSHVVTMSLGGVGSRALLNEIKSAARDGIIVLAAAGNCVRTVVWPARYPQVIAIGGTNFQDQVWKGSCRGSTVDFCAPAEMVYRAGFDLKGAGDPTVAGGQGTSYAVALTAGIAALWLSHHGREALLAEANSRGILLQELFRTAAKATARRPNIWDDSRLGAGIVDAEALLSLKPAEIPTVAFETPLTLGRDSIQELVAETTESASDSDFNWTRFGAEIASLVLDDARFGRFTGVPGTESIAGSQKPSQALREATAKSSGLALPTIIGRSIDPLAEIPRVRLGDIAEKSLKILATPETGMLESSVTMDIGDARAALDDGAIRRRLQSVEQSIGTLEGRGDVDDAAIEIRRHMLNEGERVIRAVRDAGPDTRVSRSDRVILEALVKLTGRPALRVVDGTVDVEHPELGDWQGDVVLLLSEIEKIQASVGRINIGGIHAGTGFVVGQGLVLTNRHVLETFAFPVPAKNNPSRWIVSDNAATINFDDEGRDSAKAFKIKSIAFAGPNQITGEPIIFTDLDIAVLEVETTNDDGMALPEPLEFLKEPVAATTPGRLFVMGYPARPRQIPRDQSGSIDMDVVDRLRVLFGVDYSTKYLSMGLIDTPVGSLPDDPKKWVFAHDATSLGGNSGSCVIRISDGPVGVMGLHFAGDWLRANYAHGTAAVASSGVMDASVLTRTGLSVAADG